MISWGAFPWPGADDALCAWVAGTRFSFNAATPDSSSVRLKKWVSNFCYDHSRGDDLPKIFWGLTAVWPS